VSTLAAGEAFLFANSKPGALTVVARWIEVRRAEEQEPRKRSRVERTRPGVAARRPIAERRIVPIVVPASYICEWKGEERRGVLEL